jgi:hypothetical protein
MGKLVDVARLPSNWPTHRHNEEFWTSLGRVIATFGFLEEILAKAIFALTATQRYKEDEAQEALDAWTAKLGRALSDPLGNLIDAYGKALRDYPDATSDDVDGLVADLRKATEMRNILCHSSWRPPGASGAARPFFVDRQKRILDSAIDQCFLDHVQRHSAELACAVINSVTRMGLRFPGTDGGL